MKKRILLIDDDIDDTELFADALEMTGEDTNFLHFDNGQETYNYLLSRKEQPMPDYIFIDINMPVLNGWQVIEKIRTEEMLRTLSIFMYSTSNVAADSARKGSWRN